VAESDTICSGNTATLYLSEHLGNIQWQLSYNDIYWANIEGETNTSYTTPELASKMYYRVKLSTSQCEDAYSTKVEITINSAPVGGTATADNTIICSGSSLTIVLSDYSGSIQWQQSTDSLTWSNIIGENSASLTLSSLTEDTYFRALLSKTGCDDAYSTGVEIAINSAPVGGTATADNTIICSGSSLTIVLSDYSGSIQWQQSTDNLTWSDITDENSASLTLSSLTEDTYFRALLSKTGCDDTYSTGVGITVNSPPVGGTATADNTIICSGSSLTIVLSDYSGSIQWQQSTDSLTWSNIIGENSASLTLSSLTEDTYFRAILSETGCDDAYSTGVGITINSPPVGGTATADNTIICSGSSLTIVLSDYSGSIQWQQSTDNLTWSDITDENSASLTLSSLTEDTYFRALLSITGCDDDISSVESIKVNPLPISGYNYSVDLGTVTFSDISEYADSYFWDFDDDLTSIEAEPVHIYTQTGNYQVKQRVSNNCGSDSTIQLVSITVPGINDVSQDFNVNIYPNPNTGKFNLTILSHETGEIIVRIYNIQGKEVISKTFTKNTKEFITEFDLDKLSKGVYQIKIITAKRVIDKQLLIK
ncbi:MAG: T9SS type A sorting domain-containing protein, partial [Bacteroidales bacterium]|nr:T9SS type A sorting domain-containing protein [Bacteroidales bacterium]